jgi:hypothetical protein
VLEITVHEIRGKCPIYKGLGVRQNVLENSNLLTAQQAKRGDRTFLSEGQKVFIMRRNKHDEYRS